MPLLCTLTVPERVTSSFNSMTSAGFAGAGASMRWRAPFSPGTSRARSRIPAPLARTISTLLSGTSMLPGSFSCGPRAPVRPPSASMSGGLPV